MNETNPPSEVKTKNITLGLVLAWIFGVLVGVPALMMIFSRPLSGLLLLISAVIVFPPTDKLIKAKLHLSLSRGLKIAAVVILFLLAGVATPKEEKLVETAPVQPAATSTPTVVTQKPALPKPVVKPTAPSTPVTPPASQVNTPPPVVPAVAPAPQSDRASILTILKAEATKKWSDNYQMVKYEYDQQVEAYDWVIRQTKYPSLMAAAKAKWDNNFQMVKYEYEQQAEAYEWVQAQTAYPAIMTKAKQKWGENYQMVKYEYENQVEAYQSL